MKRIYILALFSILFSLIVSAAGNVSFSVNVSNRNVRVGDKFHVILVIKNASGGVNNLPKPEIPGSRYTFGPAVAQHKDYSITNGKVSGSSLVEYTFTYVAEKEGKTTVPSVSVNIDGKKYTSRPSAINILAANASLPQPAPPSSRPVSVNDPTTQTSDRAVNGNDVFIRIITSRNSVYEQEAIECTIKLYTKYNISEFMPITQPAFNGFTVEDLPIQASLNEREIVNGQEYATAVVKKCILFPQKSGILTIISGTYDLTVVQYDQVNLGFFSVAQPTHAKKIRVNSNSATVNVQSLPSPQPAGFNGAVGQFNVKASLSTNSFRTNEPVTLNYTISGSGNLRYIKDVEVDFPSEFEQYSPQHDVDAKVVGNNVTGTSVTELTFVPKETGKFTIKVPEFVYFDPEKKEYVTIPGQQFDLNVSKGLSSAPSDRKDVASKNVDILYIRHINGSPSKTHGFIIASVWYWIMFILLICGGLGYLIFSRSKRKQSADIVGMKKSKANRVAKKRLKLAEKYMSKNDSEKFYEEILRAMWGYFSDKLSIPVADLTRSSIENQLGQKGVDKDISNNIIKLLDSCEMARYTPSGSPGQLNSIYNQACTIINALEKQKIS